MIIGYGYFLTEDQSNILDTPLDGLFIDVEPHCQSEGIIVVIISSLTDYIPATVFLHRGSQSAVTTLTAWSYVIGRGAWVCLGVLGRIEADLLAPKGYSRPR